MKKPLKGEPTDKLVSLEDIFLSHEIDDHVESMRISKEDSLEEFKKAWREMEGEVLQAQHKVYPQGGLEIPEYMASFDIGEGMDGTIIRRNEMGQVHAIHIREPLSAVDYKKAIDECVISMKAKENEYKQLILDILERVDSPFSSAVLGEELFQRMLKVKGE